MRGVDEDCRKPGADEAIAFVTDQRQRDHDEPIENCAAWKFHHFCTRLGRRLDVVEDDLAAVQGQARNDPTNARERRLLVEEGHHDTDKTIAFSLLSRRFTRTVIAELLRRGANLGARLFADLGTAAEYPGDRADPHAGVLG